MISEIENYLSFYKRIVPDFTIEELNLIKPNLKLKTFRKGVLYLKQGEVQRSMAFVSKGLIRQFYIDKKGKEISIRFNADNSFSTDYSAFIQQIPTNYNFKCLEQTSVIELSYDMIQEVYSKYKNYERFGRLIGEKVLIERQKTIESFLFENTKERYLNFLKNNPQLRNRISISHLSSYLGIERQTLSRIRKKILT
ncbi:Crp/Fnr family transcriptional regulator [Tenacibaculum agarivorans]|uniref:Crp/Fnr family transcriptional regulator n=1 Tax=Tenacibaculum agarivorans TaxID=1908389 RepID=UPI00094B9F13|nr:Crp/Fnr family transcriptional regulator [Tenacibaculum agarivorans]